MDLIVPADTTVKAQRHNHSECPQTRLVFPKLEPGKLLSSH